MVKFENTEKAYQLKSTTELRKAYYLFRLIAIPTLVKILTQLALIALKLRLPVAPIFKVSVFTQFCAGLEKNDSLAVVEKLKSSNVLSYMHYAAEGLKSEQGMDLAVEKTLETLSFSKVSKALPFAVFKATALGAIDLFEKKSAQLSFDEEENKQWNRVLERIEICCKQAQKLKVRLLIDAEESWLQPAIDSIAEDLMERFNKQTPLIFTTVQMYRKDRLDYIQEICKKAEIGDYKIGIKLVRGAYIEKERDRANERGYPSPICDSKLATDSNFDAALDFILPRLENCNLFMGSHNESSTLRAVTWMSQNGIANNDPNIWFSQLYGMADHISFNLADEGYQVVKYVPYGPVKKVIPYLIRRAEENTSVSGQTPRELSLIAQEIKRRKLA